MGRISKPAGGAKRASLRLPRALAVARISRAAILLLAALGTDDFLIMRGHLFQKCGKSGATTRAHNVYFVVHYAHSWQYIAGLNESARPGFTVYEKFYIWSPRNRF
jgi:hypothetical protein